LEVGVSVVSAQLASVHAGVAREVGEVDQVDLLRRHDPEAFAGFVRQHQDRVYDFCFRMLLDREEALEVVQEILDLRQRPPGAADLPVRLQGLHLAVPDQQEPLPQPAQVPGAPRPRALG
jgi:hypothetical protein